MILVVIDYKTSDLYSDLKLYHLLVNNLHENSWLVFGLQVAFANQ